jgi:hypothetical protein
MSLISDNISLSSMELLIIYIVILIKNSHLNIIKINLFNISYLSSLNNFVNLVFNNYSCNNQIISIYGLCIFNFNAIKAYQSNNVLTVISLIFLLLITISIKKSMMRILEQLESWIS